MELKQIPLGFHFRPKPQELCEYLICKVSSKPLPCDGIILDLDPYNPKQLVEIFSAVEKSRDEFGLFTFTKLRKRTSKMHGYNCPRRKVGKGIWHPEKTIECDIEVEGEENTYIGSAQKLSYREKGSKKNGRFLMMEYSLFEGCDYDRKSDDGAPIKYDMYKDYVLCHIVKKGKKRPNNDALAAVLKMPTPSSTSSSSQSSESEFESELP